MHGGRPTPRSPFPPHPVSSPFLPPPGGHRAPSAPSQPRQPGCRPPLPAASLSLFLEVAGALPSTLRPRHHGQRGAGGGGGAGPALGRVADPPGIRLGSRLAAVAIETEQQRDEGRATGWGRGPLGEPGGWAGRGGGGPAVGASVCLTRGTPFRTQAPPTRTPPNRGGRALPAPPRPAAPTLSWKQAWRGQSRAEAAWCAGPGGARQVQPPPTRRLAGAPPTRQRPHSRLRSPGGGIPTPRPGRGANGRADSPVGGAGGAAKAAATRRRARAEGASRPGAPTTMASKCPKCDKTVYFGECPARPAPRARPAALGRRPRTPRSPRAPGRRPGMRGPNRIRRAAGSGAAGGWS